MAQPTPPHALSPDSMGPTEPPPTVPAGWIAQWDGKTRKYYFVAIATGQSQWQIPTEPAPGAPTPGSTPFQSDSTYPRPPDAPISTGTPEGTRGVDAQDGERGFGSMAANMVLGGGKSHGSGYGGQQPSGLGAIASTLLGGGSHSGSTGSHGGGIAGQLGNILGGGSHPQQSSQYGPPAGQHGSQQSGGLLGSILGSVTHSQPPQQQGNYGGYSSAPPHAGNYSGAPPPGQYTPGGTQQYHSPPPQHGYQHQPHIGPIPGRPADAPFFVGGPGYHSQQQQGYQGGQQGYGNPQSNQYHQQGQGPYGGHGGQGGQYGGNPQGSQHSSFQHGPPPQGNQGGYPPQGAQHSGQGQYGGGGQQQYQHGNFPPPPPMNSHPNQGNYGGGQGGQGGRW